jgi:DNA repair exonuclease SbcCD ATPase subunit
VTTDLDELTLRARRHRRTLDSRSGEMRANLLRGKELKEEVEDLKVEVEDLDRVTALLNSMGEDRQFQTQQKIEELVTRGLQTIFDASLSFHIVQSVQRRSVVVEFVLRTTLGRMVIDTPVLEARGGGVAATIGFLLRLVVMLLSSGTRTENLLVLDETFAHVSAEYLSAVGEFLQEVKDKTGVQILMVTHQPELAEFADKVYRFSTEDGKTVVTDG